MPQTIFEAASSNDIVSIQGLLRAGVSVNQTFVPSDERRLIGRPVANIFYYGNWTVSWSLGAIFTIAGIAAGGFGLIFIPFSLGGAWGVDLFGKGMVGEYTFNCDRWTPLHFTAVNGAIKSAVCLINKGADIDIEDSENRTFLDIAKIMKRTNFCDVCKFIVEVNNPGTDTLNNLESRSNLALQELLSAERAMRTVEDALGVTAVLQQETDTNSVLNSAITFFKDRPESALATNIETLIDRLQGHRTRIEALTTKIRGFASELAEYKKELELTLAENTQLREYSGTLEDQINRLEESMQPRHIRATALKFEQMRV